MKKNLLIVGVTISLASYGTMGSVSTPTDYISAGKEVSAERESTNILGLTPMDSDQVSKELLEEVNKQCPNGVINIRTTQTAKAFPIVSKEKIKVCGHCK